MEPHTVQEISFLGLLRDLDLIGIAITMEHLPPLRRIGSSRNS
jgi:hypothetical protein